MLAALEIHGPGVPATFVRYCRASRRSAPAGKNANPDRVSSSNSFTITSGIALILSVNRSPSQLNLNCLMQPDVLLSHEYRQYFKKLVYVWHLVKRIESWRSESRHCGRSNQGQDQAARRVIEQRAIRTALCW